MKLLNAEIEHYRVQGRAEIGNNGAFIVPFRSFHLYVIASDGAGWDHVSVSLKNRCPNWEEMSFVKDLFFRDDETVVQFHPKKSEYINLHPYCLHLWRPHTAEVELPPWWMIGVKEPG